MGLFDAFAVSGSGMTVSRNWMDAISDNLSNMNDATSTSKPAFQARYIEAQARDYGNESASSPGGVDVAGVQLGDATGRVVHEPDNPLADKDGNVRYPDIDLSEQMGQLIVAQRSYQANASAIDRAKDAYQAALQIGAK